jgi:DNA-binding transcriptional MerR regulator
MTLKELAEATGLSERTVRYYQSLGLVRQPGQVGAGAHYSETDRLRLRLVQELSGRMTLGQIAEHFKTLDESGIREEALKYGSALDYVRSVLGEPAALESVVNSTQAAVRPPAAQIAVWERIEVVPGVELHVRQPISVARRRAIAAYVALAQREIEGES